MSAPESSKTQIFQTGNDVSVAFRDIGKLPRAPNGQTTENVNASVIWAVRPLLRDSVSYSLQTTCEFCQSGYLP